MEKRLICSRCKKDLPISDFYSSDKTRGYSYICKKCMSIKSKKDYKKNRMKILKQSKKSYVIKYKICKEKLLEFKRKSKCIDCCNTDVRVLQFDHVRGKKKFETNVSVHNRKWETVVNEIAKCEVRCANCHIIRHYNET